MKLKTQRLIIRHIQESDAPFILKLLNDPVYIAMIRDSGIREEEAARKFIFEKYIKSYFDNGFGLNLVLSASGESLGICGLVNRGLPVPDLGFAVLKEHAGKGYIQEASRKIMEYAKQELQMKKLSAITTEENKASTKVLQNLGFQFIKVIKLPDAEKELNYFEIVLR